MAACFPSRALADSTGWPDERSAGPFVCHADFRLDQHGRLLRQIAELERELNETLQIGESQESIHLFLFAKKATYQRYMKRHFPAVPYRRALFVKNGGPGMVFVYRNREFEVDVRHESTHALLHASLPMVPLWLDEGLAEYFEVPPDKRAGGNPHMTALKWSIRLSRAPRLTDLEAVHGLDKMGGAQYRHAWAWVHFMLHGPPEAREELINFLGDIRSHTPPGRLSQRLKGRLPDLNRRFIGHFKRWQR